jgi:HK97 family phage major capsid protein
VSNPGSNKKIMQAHKLAVVVPFSNEFRRDLAGLYNALVDRLPGALGKKFDQTVFFGPENTLANFDDFTGVTMQSLSGAKGVYGGLVAADTDVSEQGGIINGYIFSPQGRGMLLSALDGDDRPLFTNSVSEGAVPRILGAPTHFNAAAYKDGTAGAGTTAGTPDIVGFAGDWSRAMWGTVEGVRIDISDQASITIAQGTGTELVNLWQQNMFAVRAEIEVGFICQDTYFNGLTRTHAS